MKAIYLTRILGIFFLITISIISKAQFKLVKIGIDGLTCSACSYGTEKSIRKLDFVKDVSMDLNNKIAEIKFVDGKQVSVEALAQKVVDAGFSVRFITASFNFNNVAVSENYKYPDGNNLFCFVKTTPKQLNGEITIQFIGSKYLSKTEYKKWKDIVYRATPKTKELNFYSNIYFVTLP